MYSPDGRKEWYLEECRKSLFEGSTVDLIEKIFASTEIEEKVFNKDVCDFTDAEVVDLFKSFDSKSRIRLKTTSWYLSKYHQWCYDKGLTQKIDDAFDYKTIDNIVNSIVTEEVLLNAYFSKKDILDIINLDPDYISRAILLSIFYGIKGDDYTELLNLKMEDINKENKTVKLITNRIAYVDDIFIDLMEKANNAEEYLTIEPFKAQNPNFRIYIKSSYIIRSCVGTRGSLYDSKPAEKKFIVTRMQKFKNAYPNLEYINVANLYKSGLINYLREKYEKQNITLKNALMDCANGYYAYEKETQGYIEEFGSKMTVRFLRMELKDIINQL